MTPRKAATRDEAAAASKEGSGASRSVTVRDMEFALPDEVPFSVMLANRQLVNAAENDEPGAVNLALIDLAEAYIGKEQMKQIERLNLSATDGGEMIGELLAEIRKEFGIGEGESSASSGS